VDSEAQPVRTLYRKISSYKVASMRRKPGVLLPLEESILVTAFRLQREGSGEFHGFGMAKRLVTHGDTRKLTSHGTLYKVLDRLEVAGLLESRWEDPETATAEGRPRRRLYVLTGAGAEVGAEALSRAAAQRPASPSLKPKLAPS
jgi:PadR family transcriptional regulator PadR